MYLIITISMLGLLYYLNKNNISLDDLILGYKDNKVDTIGFFYIWKISNKNWFNEDMYKIGLTKEKNIQKINNVSFRSITVCRGETVFNIDVIGIYKAKKVNILIKKLLSYGKFPKLEDCHKNTKIRIFTDKELEYILKSIEKYKVDIINDST